MPMKKCYLIILCLLGSIFVSNAQPLTVSGVVKDDRGEAVVGASVTIKGTRTGIPTGQDGTFRITVPDRNSILVISHMGYDSREVPARENVNVVLTTSAEELEAVSVTIDAGMYKMDKRLTTGAADRLNAENVKLDGVADISRSIEGRSAGVSVQNVSATFGTAPKIRIRGATSILGTSKPLWVVDGVIMEDAADISPDQLSSGDAVTMISSAIAGLNADDIESFNILKDGSATSIYGAKAMAGVIVITTKKGRAGVSSINYTGEFTMRLKPNYADYNIMNSQNQMSVYQEMEAKGFLKLAETLRAAESGVYGKMYSLINTYNPVTGQFGLANTNQARNAYLRGAEYRNTDWFDELFSNAVMMNHSVSMSGGTEKMQSYMSLSVMNDPGWYERSEVSRYTFTANSSYKIAKNLSFTLRGNGSYRQQQAPGTLSQDVDQVSGEIKRDFDINPFSFAMNTSRTMSPDETYVRNFTGFNIFQELENNYIDIDVADLSFQGEFTWNIIPGLDFNTLASYRYSSSSLSHHIKDSSNQARAYREMSDTAIRDSNPFLYTDPDIPNALPISVLDDGGIYDKREYKTRSYTVRSSLTWNKVFNDIHIVNMFGGAEIIEAQRTNDWFRGYGMMYDQGETPFYNYLVFKQLAENNANYYTLDNRLNRSAAFFATAHYSYKGKYNANATFRYEGTNRLGKSRTARWLPTWNLGAAWNVHEEDFFKSIEDVVSHLNLKMSYSLTADAGPSYITNSTHIIMSDIPWRPTSSDREVALYINQLGNSSLTYEKKNEFNVGMSVGFLANRINLELDYYIRNNYDLLGLTNTQGAGGEVLKYANVADMKSTGIEFTLSTRNIESKDFRWTTDFTFSWSKQTITTLTSDARMMDLVLGTGYNLEGYAPYSLFSIPFKGLDSEGFPIFEIEGETVNRENYSSINFQSMSEEALKSLKYEGPTDPVYTGGLGNTFTYKRFRLNVFMTYGFGNKVRMNAIFKNSYSDVYAMSNEFKNRWMVPGDEEVTNIPVIASIRQLSNYGSYALRRGYNAYNYSTARVASGDFIRMKEISLTYDFPKEWIRDLNMSDMSLKIQVTNPFLIYAHKSLNGQDPEYFLAGGVSSPLAKQITFTIRLGF